MVNRRTALGVAALLCCLAGVGAPLQAAEPARAPVDVAGVPASEDVRYAAQRVVDTRDHRGRPFAIVDKKDAKIFLFEGTGRLIAWSPVLLGLARGDDAVPGVGDLPVERIPAAHRTTPAGRFETEPGRNLDGEDIVWMDYDAGLAIHRVRPGAAREARLQRLASGLPDAQRVSAGCVVVPIAFYEAWIRPTLGKRRGVAYVLPETRPVQALFADAAARRIASSL